MRLVKNVKYESEETENWLQVEVRMQIQGIQMYIILRPFMPKNRTRI